MWESPFTVGGSGDLALFTDRIHGSWRYWSFFPHSATGWKDWQAGRLNDPADEGCEGTNQANMDGSVKWINIEETTPQRVNFRQSAVSWWQLPD